MMELKYFSGVKSVSEVSARYKKLAVQLHPDKQGGSNEKMAELNAERDSVMQYFSIHGGATDPDLDNAFSEMGMDKTAFRSSVDRMKMQMQKSGLFSFIEKLAAQVDQENNFTTNTPPGQIFKAVFSKLTGKNSIDKKDTE